MLFSEETTRWTDEDRERQVQAAHRLLESLQSLRPGESFRITPGDYRIGVGEQCLLTGLRDVEIDAQGVTFWHSMESEGCVVFQDCSNVTFRGVVFDMDELPWIQGVITDVTDGVITLQLDEYFAKRYAEANFNEGFRVMFLTPDGSCEYDCKDCFLRRSQITVESATTLRFAFPSRLQSQVAYQLHEPSVGDRMVLGMRSGCNAMRILRCRGMVFEDISVYASAEFAFFEIGPCEGGNTYRRCKLCRRPGTERLLACAADGFHSFKQHKGPTLEDCELSWTMDDLINVHGFFSAILEQAAPDELLVATPYGTCILDNSEICIYSAPYGAELGSVKVLSCEDVSSSREEGNRRLMETYSKRFSLDFNSFWAVTISRLHLANAVKVQPGDFLASYDYCGAGAVIRNCYLHDSHVRGVLMKTRDGVIENNRIENVSLSGIILKPEFFWLEGPMPRNIMIRCNTVKDCGRIYTDTAPICVMCGCCPPPVDRMTGIHNFHGISLVGNVVDGSLAGPGICICNVENPVMEGNAVRRAWSNPKAKERINYPGRIAVESFEGDAYLKQLAGYPEVVVL